MVNIGTAEKNQWIYSLAIRVGMNSRDQLWEKSKLISKERIAVTEALGLSDFLCGVTDYYIIWESDFPGHMSCFLLTSS